MNQTVLVVIIIAALVIAAFLVVRQHKGAISNAVADLKNHDEKTIAGAVTAINNRTSTVGSVVVDKLGGDKAAKTLPVVATTSEPAPAAPAEPVADAPPPASVAAAASPSAPALAAADGSGTDSWPQLVSVDGIRVMAFAPINPLWRASTMAHVMVKGGALYVNDPSNGGLCVPPQPRRSAAGYPLHYGLGAGNAAVGAPLIIFGDMDFDTDAEVAAFLADEPARLAAGDAAAQAAANRVLTGPVPEASLTTEDWKFAWWYTDQPGHGSWISATLSGPWSAIRQQLSVWGNNPSYLHSFNAAAYNGVLRQYAK